MGILAVADDIAAVADDIAAVAGVLLNDADEPADALLVVVVTLALDDALRAAVGEMVATLLRELLLREHAFAVLILAARVVLVLLRDGVQHAILREDE